MIYKFIWNEGQGMIWWRVVLPKLEGGLGLKDPCLLAKIFTIKRVLCLRIVYSSLWMVQWMHWKYIHG